MIDKTFYIILICISICSFVLYNYIINVTGSQNAFNFDDLCTIQFAMLGGSNLLEKITLIIKYDPTNVPLFYVLSYVWIKIVGFVPDNLRIFPQILASLSVLSLGILGKIYYNNLVGIISIVLSVVSIQIVYASFQFRCYAMVILVSSLLLIIYKNRYEYKKLFLLILLLGSFTHFFVLLLIGALFMHDLYKYIVFKNKELWKVYSAYAIVFLPYLIISYSNSMAMYASFWPPKPEWIDIYTMMIELNPLNVFGVILLLIYVCKIVVETYRKTFVADEYMNFMLYVIVFCIGVTFFYSKYITSSSSVWVTRYLLIVLPCIVIANAKIISDIIVFFKDIIDKKYIKIMLCIVGIGVVVFYDFNYCINNVRRFNMGTDGFYRDALYLQKQDYSGNVIIYAPCPPQYLYGWTCFNDENNKYVIPHTICTKDELYNIELSKYDKLYLIDLVYDKTSMGEEYILKNMNVEEINPADTIKLTVYSR